jgi:hypothetical protein
MYFKKGNPKGSLFLLALGKVNLREIKPGPLPQWDREVEQTA